MARSFAVFDIDGTIIRWQLVHATIDALGKAGHLAPEDYAAIQAARMRWKNRSIPDGFVAYQNELVRVIEKTTPNLSVAVFEQATRDMFDTYKDQVYVYTRGLIRQLKREGYLLFAISGSHAEAVKLLAEYYEFDDYIATTYERKGDVLTGRINPIIGGKDKLARKLAEKYGADMAGSVAVGDSESDISLLELVEQPIAFNPDTKLFQHARQNGWRVVLERKTVIYELGSDGADGYRLEHTNV